MNLAVLGTGVLGGAIADRLAACGWAVTVYNRTREKAERLRSSRIRIAGSPEEAISQAAGVLLILADAHAINDVLSDAALTHLTARTVIQIGTIAPRESQALHRRVVEVHGDYFEAPVLGSVAEAHAGRLLVMVGATADQFAQWSDLLRCLSQQPRLIGPVGHAAALKLALNQLIAAQTVAFALSLALVQRTGVSVEDFMAILRESALYAPTFDKKLPRLLKRDYADPNFSAQHLLKDVDLVLGECRRLGLNTRSLEGVRPLLQQTIEEGFGDLDYASLFEMVGPRDSDSSGSVEAVC
jgi:3-hydroxyisobutyrate dehydrogenase